MLRRKRESPPGTLHSTNFPMRWPARKPMRAHCIYAWRQKDWEPHPCPLLEHSCGIYAVNTRERVHDWMPSNYGWIPVQSPPPPGVWGTVALWGRVLCFEKGYRAEYAYPLTLIGGNVDEELLHAISERYGIPYIPEPVAT